MRRRGDGRILASDWLDEEAITPVIGSILILGISVLGITGVMFWGAPALQIMQEQNAQAAMLGEFQEVRQNSLVLTITDSSRLPRVNLEQGSLALIEGTRMAATAMFSDALAADLLDAGCTMDLRDWSYNGDASQVRIDITDCDQTRAERVVNGCPGNSEALCIRAYQVDGRSLTQRLAESSATIGSGTGSLTLDLPVDFEGAWVIRLEDKGGTAVYGETWMLDHKAMHWKMDGQTLPFLRYEAGALFSGREKTVFFLEEQPPLAEQAFGTDEFAIRMPLLDGDEIERTGRQSTIMFLKLEDNILRVEDDVQYVQFDWEGDFAQAWCNGIELRDDDLTGGFAYTAPFADRTCDGSTHADERYTLRLSNGGTSFPFAFTHVEVGIDI